MQQTEIDQDAIEAGVFKWQILSIALDERKIRERCLCDGDHFPRKIDACWNTACLPDRIGHGTGAASDVQHRHASCNLSGIYQIGNELPRERRPHRIVFVRHPFPAFMLESVKGILHHDIKLTGKSLTERRGSTEFFARA